MGGVKEEVERWKVTADHPIFARPDKFGLSKEEAVAYADSLHPLGYENISVTIHGGRGGKEEEGWSGLR
jgi:hypothetical protein